LSFAAPFRHAVTLRRAQGGRACWTRGFHQAGDDQHRPRLHRVVDLARQPQHGDGQRPLRHPRGGDVPEKDYRLDTPFAAVCTGESLSAIGQADSSYLPDESGRGTLIAVDVPAWEGLVREGYTAFNATLVAEVKKAQR
jgi:hypothetical protein